MFTDLEHWDPLEVARLTAVSRARVDRDRFIPVLKTAEEFFRERGLIVGGAAATYMDVWDEPRDTSELPLDMYHYLAYSQHPLKDANDLARRIYEIAPEGLTQYTVALPSRDQGHETSIRVYQREIIRVVGLPRHRGVHIFKMLIPDERPGLFSGLELQCVGPEVQLMETYASLYNPQMAGDWTLLLEHEAALREVFLRDSQKKFADLDRERSEVAGGRASPRVRGRDQSGKKKETSKLAEALDKFVMAEGRIIVDDLNFRALGGGGSSSISRNILARRACVSLYPLEEEQAELLKLGQRAGATIHVLVNDPQLVNDRRLRRLTAYLLKPGSPRLPILDIYNSAEYEALPYIYLDCSPDGEREKCSVRQGTLVVVMRFLLVELWTIQLLWRMKSIEDGYAGQVLQDLLGRYRHLAEMATPENAFPVLPGHYLGRIVEPRLAEKRAMSQIGAAAGRRMVPFFPASSAKK